MGKRTPRAEPSRGGLRLTTYGVGIVHRLRAVAAYESIQVALDFNPDLSVYVVLCRVSPNKLIRDTAESRIHLQDFEHFTVCDNEITERIIFRRAISSGKSVLFCTILSQLDTASCLPARHRPSKMGQVHSTRSRQARRVRPLHTQYSTKVRVHPVRLIAASGRPTLAVSPSPSPR